MANWLARRRLASILFVLVAILLGGAMPGCLGNRPVGEPIKIGLIAPLSGGSATSGEAIQRGMLLAIDEVNGSGGVLGRPLELVTRDVLNDPAAGVEALHQLVEQHQIVAVFGGIFSPVMLGQIDALHELQIPLINPWGSVTEITRNGRDPNYAFRVSVSDEYAGEFLVRYAVKNSEAKRPGIIADTTAWGDSNVGVMTTWLARIGVAPAGVERFDQGDTNMTQQLHRLRASGADTLLMIANAPEGAAIVRGMATLGWKVPVISHWGISGGRFVDLAGTENADGVMVLQTFSFIGPLSPRGEAVLKAYHARFGTRRTEEILAPVGVAHGFDGVHLLARAIQRAETSDGPRVRDELERLEEPYDGLVKQYAPAFTSDRHDALLTEDYIMAVWKSGRLIPARHMRIDE